VRWLLLSDWAELREAAARVYGDRLLTPARPVLQHTAQQVR
jgi:hypothetical protein